MLDYFISSKLPFKCLEYLKQKKGSTFINLHLFRCFNEFLSYNNIDYSTQLVVPARLTIKTVLV